MLLTRERTHPPMAEPTHSAATMSSVISIVTQMREQDSREWHCLGHRQSCQLRWHLLCVVKNHSLRLSKSFSSWLHLHHHLHRPLPCPARLIHWFSVGPLPDAASPRLLVGIGWLGLPSTGQCREKGSHLWRPAISNLSFLPFNKTYPAFPAHTVFVLPLRMGETVTVLSWPGAIYEVLETQGTNI